MGAKRPKPSDIPFVREVHFSYGVPDRLSPLVRRVIAENPGPFTYTGSGAYIIGRSEGPVAVIDPGPGLDAHIDALCAAIGDAPVSHILITHTHLDHCGGARRFADRVRAPILGFGPHAARHAGEDAPALDEGGDYGFTPDIRLADGETVAGPGWTLQAVHTPGHLSNHLCFALREEMALFTGDHVMGWATTVVAPPDGDMAAYLDSLETLLRREDVIYYPTHGAPIPDPKPFVRAVRAHRMIRDGQILEQLRAGRSDIRAITTAMYADIDARLHGAAALNVYAHLIRLAAIGAVEPVDPAETGGPIPMQARFRIVTPR